MNALLKKIILMQILMVTPLFGQVNYSKMSNQTFNKCIEEVKKKYPISVLGTGGAGGYDIEAVFITYQYRGEADITKARRLYVEISEIFIKAYNSNKELRPYLHTYPFTHRHLGLAILFDNTTRNERNIDSVSGLVDIDYDQEIAPEFYREKTLCTESYETALEIVRQEREQESLQVAIKGTI